MDREGITSFVRRTNMESIFVKEFIAILIFMLCIMHFNPNFYTNILENTSEVCKALGANVDCYNIYSIAKDKHGKHYKTVLASAAAHVTIMMTNFAILIWSVTDTMVSASTDNVLIKWFISIGIAIALSAISILFGWIFYISCKHHKESNISVDNNAR